jgi:predicted ferric reductase
MSKRAKRALWSSVVALLLVGPPVVYLGRRLDAGTDLVMVLAGVVATVAMIVATVGASRLRAVTTALGIDRVMRWHRWLGVAAVVLVLVHLVLAVVERPARLAVLTAPTSVQLGWASVAGTVVLAAAAAWGRRRTTRHEWWARVHILGAAVALVLAGLHIWWVGDLVADPVMRVVCTALAVTLLGVLARRWVWQPLFSRHGAYVVTEVRREGGDVVTLALAPVFRRRPLRFAPGQFVWLRLQRRIAGVEEHPFTIASSAELTDRLELTVRAGGDFSRGLARLEPGRRVWLDGPHGSFTPEFTPEAAGRVDGLVLIAGGVGVTPMMSMLRTLLERDDHRPVLLVLAERPDRPLFDTELADLPRRLPVEVARTHGRRVDADLLAELLPQDASRLEYYVCGPPALLSGALAALDQLGVPPARVHREQFGWTGETPRPRAAAAAAVSVPSVPDGEG